MLGPADSSARGALMPAVFRAHLGPPQDSARSIAGSVSTDRLTARPTRRRAHA
jgi:hypothetical protein